MFKMNVGDLRRCEVLDLFMPVSYMIKFDFEKQDILDKNVFWSISQNPNDSIIEHQNAGKIVTSQYVYAHPDALELYEKSLGSKKADKFDKKLVAALKNDLCNNILSHKFEKIVLENKTLQIYEYSEDTPLKNKFLMGN